jgi:hypothetical protein
VVLFEQMNPLLLGTAAAFGLAGSAGLNTTLPLLTVGLLARWGLLRLSPPFDALSGDLTLAGLVLLAGLELVADKVSGADSIVHAIQLPLAAAAGAILFASQTSVISDVSPQLAILVGLLTAGAIHTARAAARPQMTMAFFGFANPLVSALEDAGALLLALTSALSPLLGFVLFLGLAVTALLALRWAIRSGRRLLGWLACPGGRPATPCPDRNPPLARRS